MKKIYFIIAFLLLLVPAGSFSQSIWFNQPSDASYYTNPGGSTASVPVSLNHNALPLPWHSPYDRLWIDGNQQTYNPLYPPNYYALGIGNHTLHAELWEYDITGTPYKLTEANRNVSVIATYQITVQNSFGGGLLKVDNVNVNSGQLFAWRQGENHTITALDGQTYGGYVRRFTTWSGSSSSSSLSIPVTVTSNASYVANFLMQYNLTFSTSFGGGTVTVDNTSRPSGYQQTLLQLQSISFSAQSTYSLQGYYCGDPRQ